MTKSNLNSNFNTFVKKISLLNSSFPKYKNKLVAELAWVIGSAPSMAISGNEMGYSSLDAAWCAEQLELHQSWLDYLDDNPKDIEDYFPHTKKMLLGKRFEAFVQYWFQESPYFHLLAHNVQLQKKGRTLGEIDFIVQDRSNNQVLHIEVACKFYLAERNSGEWKHWIGPNGKDSLELKMKKLDKQLAICDTEEGIKFLKAEGIERPRPMLFMKGYFFHHYKSLTNSKSPKLSAPNYLSGWWVDEQDLDAFLSPASMWMILEKENWLAPFYSSSPSSQIISADKMKLEARSWLNKYQRSLMLVQVLVEDGVAFEISRGVVFKKL